MNEDQINVIAVVFLTPFFYCSTYITSSGQLKELGPAAAADMAGHEVSDKNKKETHTHEYKSVLTTYIMVAPLAYPD